jgi:hypothetical protein
MGESLTARGVRTALRWHVHGAAQNRREKVWTVSRTIGAPSFSPYRSGVVQDRSLRLSAWAAVGPLPNGLTTYSGYVDKRQIATGAVRSS